LRDFDLVAFIDSAYGTINHMPNHSFAERRMKLYHITKNDVTFIIDQGRREISHSGKIK